MTEDEARQVLLLQAHESGTDRAAGAPAAWTEEDRRWATRQAVAAVGEQAVPERFVLARTAVALQRLLPRHRAAQRWLQRRAWHPAWVLLAALLGLIAGLAVDQLGPPQRVNLLAPAVWAVVGWNALVYLALLLPHPAGGVRNLLARGFKGGDDEVALLWSRHAAPLNLQRLAWVLHVAAAALAAGLIASLYLRGLVLDYRVGWQSTFLHAPTVQAALDVMLAPARVVTGIAVPDVAPLQLAPGADAQASAAPWIHLLAATLAWAVVLPRLLLAAWAASRAARLARHFPLPLDTPYFEGLHPLMRPGLTPVVRLLWVDDAGATPVGLFGVDIGRLDGPLTLASSDEGDALQLLPVPPGVGGALAQQGAPAPWWRRWLAPLGPARTPQARLRDGIDAVLLLTRPGQAQPSWLAELERPVVVLVDTPEAEPPRLSLHARHDGWLAEGRLLRALEQALPADPRLQRLRRAWQTQQQARLDAGMQLLADSLGRIAAIHQPVVDDGFLARRAEAQAAQVALQSALQTEWNLGAEQLRKWLGRTGPGPQSGVAGNTAGNTAGTAAQPTDATASADASTPGSEGPPAAAMQLKARVGEGRAALVGGVVSGALAGLKADLLSGGLTMGAGLVAGGLLGALGAAGLAKGVNVVRGTDRSYAAFSEEALAPITAGLLQRYLVLAHDLAPDRAQALLASALAAQQPALLALWRGRDRRVDNAGEAQRLAQQLQPLLRQVVLQALGGPDGAWAGQAQARPAAAS